jgi:hypothetical protein
MTGQYGRKTVKTILWAMALATTKIAAVHASDTANEKPVLLTTEVAPANMTTEQATAKHEVLYPDVWADDKGVTHVSQCVLTGLDLDSFAPPASPYYFGLAPEDVQSLVFSVLPKGWYGDWHHAPGPQWVITLSGAWEIQTADGSTLRQGPGEFQFNSDESAYAGTPEAHVGHTAKQVGDVPNVRVIITLKKNPLQTYANKPCVL